MKEGGWTLFPEEEGARSDFEGPVRWDRVQSPSFQVGKPGPERG